MKCEITVECADIVDYSCDVLVLKFAQAFYGTDGLVANTIKPNQLEKVSPLPNSFTLIPSENKIAAKYVLFVGVVPLYNFDYGQIRKFASLSLHILARKMPDVSNIAMTMHGTGYGLDERESFLAQIGGLLDAFHTKTIADSLQRVTIVEKQKDRAERLKKILKKYLSSEYFDDQQSTFPTITSAAIDSAGIDSNEKPHVFVAMPFSKEMEDTYRYGILNPINSAGFLCERVDMETFTGDILLRIKSRIESASLVVADLTGANPNVYLEVGYAWGKNRPTLLISKNSDELKFDVKSQRCIIYENISDLEKKLSSDLEALKKQKL